MYKYQSVNQSVSDGINPHHWMQLTK